MNNKNHVVLGLSGGVDSTIAGKLLKDAGYQVSAVLLHTWRPDSIESEEGLNEEVIRSAERNAQAVGISFCSLDVRELFRKEVVSYFLDSYEEGFTPNPCVRCNRDLKWRSLLSIADDMGAHWIATGHYARLSRENGKTCLLKGVDPVKDQSYFLSHLTQRELTRTFFPNGEYQKGEIKKIARDAGLVVADRPESQDLCFLEGHDYRTFLERYRPGVMQTGKIVDSSGNVLGQHNGLANYTIGQRKGLGVSSTEPLYVLGKDTQSNLLILGSGSELGRSQFFVGRINWICQNSFSFSDTVNVKIRSQAKAVEARLSAKEEGVYEVEIEKALRDITPGQFAVFYQGEYVLGGGVILPFKPLL